MRLPNLLLKRVTARSPMLFADGVANESQRHVTLAIFFLYFISSIEVFLISIHL